MYAKDDKQESQNIHKRVELKRPPHISGRQNSASGSISAASHTQGKDICAAAAQAPNQVLAGFHFCHGTDSNA